MKFAIEQLQSLQRIIARLEHRLAILEAIESDANHTHAIYVALTGNQTVAGVKTFSSGLISQAPSATDIPVIVDGAASQTAVLQRWRTNAGVSVGELGPDGKFALGGGISTERVRVIWPNIVIGTVVDVLRFGPTSAVASNADLVVRAARDATNPYTAIQSQRTGSSTGYPLLLNPDGGRVDVGAMQTIPTGSTAKATSNVYDLTVTFPQAATRLHCEFRGWINDSATFNATSMLRFSFRILKLTANATAAAAATGEFAAIAPVSGISVSSIAVQATTDTTVTIRVTMSGASTASLNASGTLIVTGGTNYILSGAWA